MKKQEGFRDLRIVDNFYQTSAFFPMPTVLAGTVSENGIYNPGIYLMAFPYYIEGKDCYVLSPEVHDGLNTAQHNLRTNNV